MKRLLVFVMAALLFFPAFAANEYFELDIHNNKIIHKKSDWEFLMHENTYSFSVSKKIKKLDDDTFLVHSLIEFDEPHNYTTFRDPTDKIYTMGAISCSRQSIMLLRQIFVKSGNEIQAIQPIQPNEYVSELETPGTARNQMYLKICSGEIV
jgi:hypothetical protein